MVSRLFARFLRQECAFCGRRPGEYLSRTPSISQNMAIGRPNTPAPDWLPRDPETGLRFCRESCRSLYAVKGGIPPRHRIQPQTQFEESLVAVADEEWSDADDEDLIAVPDHQVGRDVSTGFIIGRLVGAAALFLAVLELPYSYYQILRFIVCGLGLWGLYEAHAANRQGWTWVFGGLALLFNPVVPIALSRGGWAAVDIVSGVALLASLRYLTPERDVPALNFDFPWWEAGAEDEPVLPRDWPEDEPPPNAVGGIKDSST